MKNTKMVLVQKDDLKTTTEVIAKGMGKEHKNVIELLKRHIVDLNDFGIIAFQTRKSKRGKPTEYALLNESQTYYLITLMRNNVEAKKFKKALVKEFVHMRKVLNGLAVMKQSEQYKQIRSDGKIARLETTDTIKQFVEYATNQGSKHANTYYANITKMENKSLFILEQKFPNVREMLNHQQLSTLKVVDKMIEDILQEEMENKTHYKDIYKIAKERVKRFAELVKPTTVVSPTEVKVIEQEEK